MNSAKKIQSFSIYLHLHYKWTKVIRQNLSPFLSHCKLEHTIWIIPEHYGNWRLNFSPEIYFSSVHILSRSNTSSEITRENFKLQCNCYIFFLCTQKVKWHKFNFLGVRINALYIVSEESESDRSYIEFFNLRERNLAKHKITSINPVLHDFFRC